MSAPPHLFTRLGLAVVLVFCCAPLFIGLGVADVENDEAIYSFAVDRIVESGGWLTPKSSPSETIPFLEKPPLKIWMTAAPIRLGLVPRNEFGLRVSDAVMSAAAFVYVFASAVAMSNAIGGAVAVLILFVHWPLMMAHGLRSNNMEAALVLSYAGGIYHFLCWTRAAVPKARWLHALAVSLYFVLGFMTKFVAAIFLPAIIGIAIVGSRTTRRAALRDWRLWVAGCAVAAALIVPWFAYEHLTFGAEFWRTIVGLHVYQRFTASLDPAHLQPWTFYFARLYEWFHFSGTFLLIIGGVGLMVFRAVRLQNLDAAVMLLWAGLPLAAISAGTSKLYHYEYPFLPPLAIGAGVLIAAAVPVVDRWLRTTLAAISRRPIRRTWFHTVCAAVAIAAFAVAVATLLLGPIDLQAGSVRLFKNGGTLRPALVLLFFGLAGGQFELVRRTAIPLLVLGVLPLPAYREVLAHLRTAPHPLRSAASCIAAVHQRHPAAVSAGLYVDAPDEDLLHAANYYFRRVQPWERPGMPGTGDVERRLESGSTTPLIVDGARYRGLRSQDAIPDVPHIDFGKFVLILPGPFAACAHGGDPPS